MTYHEPLPRTPSTRPFSILVVASDPAAMDDLVGSSRSGPRPFHVEAVPRLSDGLCRLGEGLWNAVLLDPYQNGCTPDETLRLYRDEAVSVPTILLTPHVAPELERRCVEAGIVAYLAPSDATADAIAAIVDRCTGLVSMADARSSERLNASILDALPAEVALVSFSGTVVAVNRAWTEALESGAIRFRSGAAIFEKVPESVAPTGIMSHEAIEGIRSVLEGRTEQFTLEMKEFRGRTASYRLTVTPYEVGALRYALLMLTEDPTTEMSQSHLRSIVDAMDDVIFTLDLNGRHTGIYGSWVQRTGLTEAHFLGKTAREILGADAAAPHEAAIATARTGRTVTYLWTGRSPEGVRTFQTTLSPVLDRAGATTAIVGVGRDVTEIHRLQEDMSIMSTALDQAPVSVVMTDAQSNIEYVNPAFEALSGYSLSEVLGRNPRLLQSGLTPRETYQEMWETLTRGDSWKGTFANRRKDGTTYWESALIMPVRSDDGAIAHYVAIKQNITAQRIEEERARRSQDRFEKAFRSNPTPMLLLSASDGRVLEVNEAALRALRIARQDLVGRAWFAMNRVIDGEEIEALQRKIASEGFIRDVTLEIARGDGTRAEVLFTSEQIDLDDGPSILTHFVDLTEQRRAEQALRESEANYRLLFVNNPHPMWAYDLETLRFLAVNDAAVESYGYSRDEFLSMSIADIRPPEDVERLKANVRAVQDGIEDAGVWRHRKKDGRIIDVHITSHTMTFDGRRAEIVLAQDVTERLAAERELRQSEDRYRRLFEETTSAVFISRTDGTLESCNPAFLRIFGFADAAEAFRRNMKEMYPSADVRRELYDRLRRERSVEGLSLDLIKADGSSISVIANISGIFDEQGALVGTQGYLTDDTMRRKLEQQLFQVQKMESLGTLAGGIAHDFNNILGIILAHGGLIPHYTERPEKLQSSLDAVSKACERGAGLVRQLMTFARLNEPAREMVRLNEQVDEIMKLMRETFPKFIEQGHAYVDPSPVVNVDPIQFHQVLLNLCVNARDAMMPNGGSLKITTRIWHGNELEARLPGAPGGDYAEVCVSDTGMGMDEATKARIFEPFFTTKPKGRGTGLGLSTVYGIVNAHQGFIDVESRIGEGTSFHVFLPASPLPGNGRMVHTTEVAESQGHGTILLVEDEEALRDATGSGLEQLGYHVRKAADVTEALDILGHDPEAIDLMLTDFGLPKQNGGELVARARSMRPDLPVIVVTGFLEPEQRRALLDLRVGTILMKPVRFKEVALAIQKGLERGVHA